MSNPFRIWALRVNDSNKIGEQMLSSVEHIQVIYTVESCDRVGVFTEYPHLNIARFKFMSAITKKIQMMQAAPKLFLLREMQLVGVTV